MGIINELIQGIIIGYGELMNTFPPIYSDLVNVFIFAVLISLYSVFTWKFYRYLSKKDLIHLNLGQYNRTTHPFMNKLFAVLLYLLEYLVILPFLIFFWFAILALIILVLSEELTAGQIILVSAAMVAAVRMLAYYEEDLSKDLAKMFPFTVLAIFILSPGFFSLQRVVDKIAEIPTFFRSIILFLVLIIAVEFLLRIIDLIFRLFRSESGHDVDTVVEQPQAQQQQTQE